LCRQLPKVYKVYLGVYQNQVLSHMQTEIRENYMEKGFASRPLDSSHPLRIALCPPELDLLQRVMRGESADATFIIQAYIAEGLRNRGHCVKLLGAYNFEGPIYSGEINNLQPTRLSWTGKPPFEFARKAVWQVQRLLGIPYLNIFSNLRLIDACLQSLPGHDVVYERNTMYRFAVAAASKQLGLPYVLYVEADDILEHDIMMKPLTGLLRQQAARAFRYNLGAADRIICVSEPLKVHLIEKWKMPAEKIIVFPNVADVRRFRPDPDAREMVRASFGIGNSPLIIFVGSFYEWHDVAALLKAFVRVLMVYPDARLMLVGDGAKRQAMMELAIELGIAQTVIFTGMIAHTDVPRFMAAADIAVVPYPDLQQDIWLSPLKLFEYMATGNAIIASDVGQLSEWVANERNGLLVPPGDISALATEIERLISNPGLRMRLGQNARAEAIQKHSWDRYISDLEDVYFSVIKKRKS
jgi:glycosyltransferase involved in cell wall biosynthesis